MDPLKPLPPLPSLPPLQGSEEETAGEQRTRGKKASRLLGWATVAAIVTALAVGVLHAIGAHIFEAFWRQLN